MTQKTRPTVLLVDGYSLIFRGFHALPILTTQSGEYTNAVHGFFNMLFTILPNLRTGVHTFTTYFIDISKQCQYIFFMKL